ncbi:hypothetical protein BH24ACT10_BH24ACT10_15950 [soil metagenome]
MGTARLPRTVSTGWSVPAAPLQVCPEPHRRVGALPGQYVKADLEHVPLVSDPVTGMMVLKMVYRAGFTNLWHSNPAPTGSTS